MNNKVNLHPGAAKSLDEKGNLLAAQVEVKTDTGAQVPRPDRHLIPAVVFRPEELRGLEHMTKDHAGTLLSRFKQVGTSLIGFSEAPYRELRILAESIQRAPGFCNTVSTSSLEGAIFDWAIDRHLSATDQQLSVRLIDEYNYRVREQWIWVPVHGLQTDYDFQLGKVIVHPFRPAFFETWEASLRTRNLLDERMQATVNHTRTRLQGKAACTLQVIAEPERALELALSETRNTLAMLRVFQPAILHPLLSSYIVPLGEEVVIGYEAVTVENGFVRGVSTGTKEALGYWILDTDTMGMMQEAGLGALQAIYNEPTPSQFQKDLWQSAWTYSRSSLQKTVEDRMLYLFRALDSFLLKDAAEAIQQNIGERIAFTVSTDPDERQSIVKTVVKAYGLRSGVVHHNRTIGEMELVTQFLQIVFRFFVTIINCHRDFVTRQEYLASIDRKKFA